MDRHRTAVATGRYGEIEGLVEDRVVFAHYRDHGDWSPAVLDLVCDRLSPGTVIDVGANIGLFSIPVAQRTSARCVAFEPEPTNFGLLRDNVARHGLSDRIACQQVAVYSEAARLTMALSADNAGDHHVNTAADAQGVEVRADTLDALLADEPLAPPVVLKVDTQGSELRVIEGARALLPRIDHCIVEYWPAGLLRLGDRARALREALSDFAHAALLPQDQSAPELVPTSELWARLEFLADDDAGFFDLLLTRHADALGGSAS